MTSTLSIKQPTDHRKLRLVPALVVLSCWVGLVQAQEPYRQFLQKLREQQLFDIALVYLDDIGQRQGLAPEFRDSLALERALLFQDSAERLPAKSPQRIERLNATEASFRKFIEDYPKHPRRSEARLRLGELLQTRAKEAIAVAVSEQMRTTPANQPPTAELRLGGQPMPEQGVPEALKYFEAAHQLFEAAIAELAEIEQQMRGLRIDPNDKERVAYRNQVRLELREAQLYSAKAVEDRGRVRPRKDPNREADLQKAVAMYSDLYRKETGYAGIRSFALFYRSGAQAELGKLDDAADGYQRIVDLEDVDELRPIQFAALAEWIQVLAAQDKFQPAVDRADSWISKIRPDERETAEVLSLKLAYAKVRLLWIKKLTDEGDSRLTGKLDRTVRNDLRALMLRSPPEFSEQAKQLLGSMGVAASESQSLELPKISSLTQALEESLKRIEDADAEALNVANLDQKIEALQGQEKEDLLAQRGPLQAQIDQLRQLALQILREGISRYDSRQETREQLSAARMRMAYLHLKLQETREAIVIGEFLSRTSPGTTQGLNAASLVLQAFSDLLRRPDAQASGVMQELSPFAEYLVQTWPQSSEAVAASGALTQLAIVAKDWDAAERYLNKLPSTATDVGKQYADLGDALNQQYRQLLADKNHDPVQLQQLRDRTAKWLQLAFDNLGAADPAVRLNTAKSLAQIRLVEDRVDDAAKLLLDGEQSPIKWLDQQPQSVTNFAAMDAYRTAMQVTVQQIVDGKVDQQSAIPTILGYVTKLQTLGTGSDENQARMLAMFTSMSSDLKSKLNKLSNPGSRAALAEVMMITLSEAAKSDSFSTQQWAAETLVAVGEGTENQGRPSEASQKAFGKASELLEKMLEKNSQQADWIPPNSLDTVRILRARACEGKGDFTGAIKEYAQILDRNDTYLELQIAVARVLQKSAENNPTVYKAAMMGARPSAKTKRNVFWGWGRIGVELSSRVNDYPDQFFEARFQLAKCRMLYALSLNNPADRKKELAAAERILNETSSLYPKLGGPDDVKRNTALLDQIRKEIGG